MRYAKLAFVFLGLAAILVAAEPFAGTWKLNSAKTKYKTGTAPKEQTVTISEAGTDLDVTLSGTAADGSAIMSHYTVPAQGGDGKIIQSTYEAVSGKRIGPNEREITYSKGGKAMLTAHSRVSADGKTLTVNVKGTDAQSKPVVGVAVYDKQ
jgi:azurin